jgi:hypothetical protein
MLITRATHPSTLWPGVKSFFGLTYEKWDPLYTQIFEEQTSDKAYEEVSEATGFGMAKRKSEGQSIEYDTDGEGPKSRYTNVTYGLGYIVSREEIEDDQYTYVSQNRAKALSFSMQATKETVHANILNRAFDANYKGADGVSLISDSHPTRGGLQSNKVADADLSESSLEDAFKLMWAAKNARGLPIVLRATKLVIHPSELFNATRILKSAMRVGTANNDTNAIRAMGIAPDVVGNPYLTDLDAWFLLTNAPNGLLTMKRRAVELQKADDFDTENVKAKATERYAAGWSDPRAIFGSQGV